MPSISINESLPSEIKDRLLFSIPKDSERGLLLSSQLQRNILTSLIPTTKSLDETEISHIYQMGLGKQGSPIGQLKRTIPTSPDRVLDAPGLLDDFYLNVLDWSVRNVLAVALGPSVYLWNGSDGTVKELMTLPEDGDHYASSLSWIHDGKALAIGTSEGCVQIWDVEKSLKIRTLVCTPNSRVSCVSWNRHLLSCGSRNGQIQTSDVRVAKHLQTQHLTNGNHEICGLKWSPDGQQLASGSNNNLVQIWDVNMAESKYELEGHKSAVKALSWCPWKGNILASGGGSQDKSIKLWNTLSGECLTSADAYSQVSSLVWSRNSRELVSAHGYDRNHIALWRCGGDFTELEQVGSIDRAHDTRILQMCLSPDGKTVATASGDESIKFWPFFASPSSSSFCKKSFDDRNTQSTINSPFSMRTKSFR